MKIPTEAMVGYPLEEVTWNEAFQKMDLVMIVSWTPEAKHKVI